MVSCFYKDLGGYIEWFHCLNVFLGLFRGVMIGIIEFVISSEQFLLGCFIRRSNHFRPDFPADGFHHGHVLEIIVSLEESVSCAEFDEDTTDGPYVTGEAPTASENDFGCAIMTCAHQVRMVLVVESCTAEIDQTHFCVAKDFLSSVTTLVY